jgi:hypothetical protein
VPQWHPIIAFPCQTEEYPDHVTQHGLATLAVTNVENELSPLPFNKSSMSLSSWQTASSAAELKQS